MVTIGPYNLAMKQPLDISDSSSVATVLSQLTGLEFEDWIRDCYERQGRLCAKTPKHADYGVDLIVTEPKGDKHAIQVKLRNGRNVGVEAIAQVTAGREHYGCLQASVVTNSKFTLPARKLAKTNGVSLIDGDDIVSTFGLPLFETAHVPSHAKKSVSGPSPSPQNGDEEIDEELLNEAMTLLEKLNEFDEKNKYRLSMEKPYEEGDPFGAMHPYEWQLKFHNASDEHSERALICANRVGKSMTGAREVAAHLTGEYPDWWEGRRFNHGVRAWVGSDTNETSREIVQAALLGDQASPGWIPVDSIVDVKYRQAGIADVVDYFTVRHASSGTSRCVFKTYEQGRKKWQGTSQHLIWFDEEPPQDIWTEGLTRTLDTEGLTFMTFTPLEGASDVVMHYVDGGDGIWVLSATWEDAPHLSDAEKARMLLSYPSHERDTRAKGIPLAGSGLIYGTPDEIIAIESFKIPNYFSRIAGIDFGIDHPFAAAWMAWDRDLDIIYVYDAYETRGETAAYHVEAIRSRGESIPVSWPHDGMHREKSSGEPLANAYREKGLNMLHVSARYDDDKGGAVAREPIVHECDERMRTGRLRVFSHLTEWFREKRMYHRKDGKIVAKFDNILSAMHYGIMMKRYARNRVERVLPPQAESYDPFSVLTHGSL